MGTDFTAEAWEGLFHVHSSFSADGKLGLAELKTECVRRGMRFMVVTDHAEDLGAVELRDYVSQCRLLSGRGFLAVPGLEFRLPEMDETHLIVAGWDDPHPGEYVPAPEICAGAVAGRNVNLVVLAHPFKTNPPRPLPPEIEAGLDAVEVWNASCDSRYLPDYRAIRIYRDLKSRRPGLVGIGGLDLHDSSGFRGLRIRLRGECRTAAELVSRLKAGEFENVGAYLSMRSSPDYGRAALALLSVGRHILDAADSIISRANCAWRSK